ncbi:MAG TPA: hypothetical protein VKU87_04400 [Thermomicrobiaceae bacterium]|nr:hypothetical protein [Thermomicrobiaceae bacterium]
MASSEQLELIARAIAENLSSPNELDRNLEPANVVDGLYAIARAVHHLARAVERFNPTPDDAEQQP